MENSKENNLLEILKRLKNLEKEKKNLDRIITSVERLNEKYKKNIELYEKHFLFCEEIIKNKCIEEDRIKFLCKEMENDLENLKEENYNLKKRLEIIDNNLTKKEKLNKKELFCLFFLILLFFLFAAYSYIKNYFYLIKYKKK